jgi:hypothetical protein
MENIFLELSKFNHITYFDEPHEYYSDGKKLTSVTTFIGKFKEKFDTQGMAESYAAKRGLNVLDVISDWDYKRDFSTVKGSAVHLYAENLWNNKTTMFSKLVFSVLPEIGPSQNGPYQKGSKTQKQRNINEKIEHIPKTLNT